DRDRELLRRYVQRGLHAVVEQPGGQSAVQAVVSGTSGRHLLELVVPLLRKTPTPPTNHPSPLAAQAHPTGDGRYLPGSEWLSLTVLAPAPHHEDILIDLHGLVSTMEGEFDRWFWLRYNSQALGPHVRVRFNGKPAVLGGEILPAVSAWCS